jgi:hypothetical protein
LQQYFLKFLLQLIIFVEILITAVFVDILITAVFLDIFFTAGGGWSAKAADTNQYITVLFYNTIVVKAIVTAGRTDVDEWVSQYQIQYQETYYSEWLKYNDPPGTVKVNISYKMCISVIHQSSSVKGKFSLEYLI